MMIVGTERRISIRIFKWMCIMRNTYYYYYYYYYSSYSYYQVLVLPLLVKFNAQTSDK